MDKVYFIRNPESDYKQLGKDALRLLKNIVSDTGHKFEKEVPIKVHLVKRAIRPYPCSML